MKTTTSGKGKLSQIVGKRIPICPECGTLLEIKHHPFDEKIPHYLGYPFVGFLVGFLTEQYWLVGVSVILFFVAIVVVSKKITSPEYRGWKVWKIYEKGQ